MCAAEQVRFDPQGLHFKTMKSMDKAARLAMMPDYEMFCLDLTEGVFMSSIYICFGNWLNFLIMCYNL